MSRSGTFKKGVTPGTLGVIDRFAGRCAGTGAFTGAAARVGAALAGAGALNPIRSGVCVGVAAGANPGTREAISVAFGTEGAVFICGGGRLKRISACCNSGATGDWAPTA